MKTQAIHTTQTILQPFFGRLANQTTHNLTRVARLSAVATSHDHKEVTMRSQATKHNDRIGISLTKKISTLCSLFAVLVVLLASASYASAQVTGGTWTQVAAPFPGCQSDASLLLTDGRVLVQDGCNNTDWYTLKPDIYGSYINGTWKQVASIPQTWNYAPHLFGSAVLPNGRVIIEGGEHNQYPNGAIYDPVADTWTFVPAPGFGSTCGSNGESWCAIGGPPTVVLPDGTYMIGDGNYPPEGFLEALLPPPYDPNKKGKGWTQTGTNKNGINSEEGWTLLPDFPSPGGHPLVMTVDINPGTQNVCTGSNSTELYDGSTGSWYCLGSTPNTLYPTNEMGPAILRPDGTVFQAGANQYTAILSPITAIPPTTNPWAAGPVFPTDSSRNQLVMDDGPAALLPNGNVLMMASPCQSCRPSTFLELTPGSSNPPNQLFAVSPFTGENLSSNQGEMLVLPTGQILFISVNGGSGYLGGILEIYTPTNPNYNPSWAPVICGGSCSYNQPVQITNNVPNQISGLQFNGMSQGAAWGDEYQDATNYPLVRITDWSGTQPVVYYCRTGDHSYMGVQSGNLTVSTLFDCPDVPTGTVGDLEVVANGIPSNKMLVSVVQAPACSYSYPYC